MAEDKPTTRYFSVAEANALLPELELRFGKVMAVRAELRVAHEVLEQLGETPTVESLSDPDGPPEIVAARGRFRDLMERFSGELEAIEATGVMVKDVDIGLCDFLGEVNGEDVWLCWQFGEKQVGFWHPLDSGYAGRIAIEGVVEPRIFH